MIDLGCSIFIDNLALTKLGKDCQVPGNSRVIGSGQVGLLTRPGELTSLS